MSVSIPVEEVARLLFENRRYDVVTLGYDNRYAEQSDGESDDDFIARITEALKSHYGEAAE